VNVAQASALSTTRDAPARKPSAREPGKDNKRARKKLK
jgi:hypothetical protein